MESDPQIRLSSPGAAESWREIKLYDETRRPRAWNELLGPAQCAVLFRRVDSETPLAPDGAAVANFRDCTFLLFDRLEDGRRFCESRVQKFPHMCCEIFDSEGRAKPPLLSIVHPDAAEKDVISATSVRKRTIAALVLFVVALPLIWWDWHSGSRLILPTVLGINMIFIGLRLFQWNAARGQRVGEEKKRLEAHLAKEKLRAQGGQL
jgi:hypothetical protein